MIVDFKKINFIIYLIIFKSSSLTGVISIKKYFIFHNNFYKKFIVEHYFSLQFYFKNQSIKNYNKNSF